MANDVRIKISLQNADGDYYSAVQNADNSWTVSANPTPAYIKHLHKDWDKTDITWERNMTYWGIFRSQTCTFIFTKDARAILLSLLFGGGGVNAYCKMNIHLFNEATFSYDIFYSSEIDFTAASDDKQHQQLTIATLDCRLYELLKSRGNSNINIPFWRWTGSEWDTEAIFLRHTGIKALWRANFRGASSPTTLEEFTVQGFNGGRHGTLPNQGAHMIPVLTNHTIVHSNGTTSFAGNDLFEPVIKSFPQTPRVNEVNFLDNGNINASNVCVIKPLIENVEMIFELNAKIDGDINFTAAPPSVFSLRFVLFEINEDGEPNQTTPGQYDIFATLYTFTLGTTTPYTPPSSGVFSSTNLVSLNPFKAYVLGMVFDDATATADTTNDCNFYMSKLELYIYSNSNSGTSSPVDAPMLPPSTIVGFRPEQVWSKLLDAIDSEETDAYGFPVYMGSAYSGLSDYLSNDSVDPDVRAENVDYMPHFSMMTSENAMRSVVGIPYMSTSISEFYQTFHKIRGCALTLEGDNVLRIEKLADIFEDAQMLDLESNVYGLKIYPLTEIMGCKLDGGYGDPQTNKNFGCDAFCIPMQWNLPTTKTPKALDFQVTEVITDMYAIEKMRQQNDSNNGAPSSGNNNVIIEITETVFDVIDVTDPSGGTVSGVNAYGLYQYPTAQSTDPTAAIHPYIKGLYYPDTAYNLGLTPTSNERRRSGLTRTLCDGMETTNFVSFRKQYNMKYTDPSAPALSLPGISKNLYWGLIDEVADMAISSFDSKFFRPYILEFVSQYPVNMYSSINTYPKRYIRFENDGQEYKGYIYQVQQMAGNNQATTFKLLAHKTTSDAALLRN